jgi:hypothetical protein
LFSNGFILKFKLCKQYDNPRTLKGGKQLWQIIREIKI